MFGLTLHRSRRLLRTFAPKNCAPWRALVVPVDHLKENLAALNSALTDAELESFRWVFGDGLNSLT